MPKWKLEDKAAAEMLPRSTEIEGNPRCMTARIDTRNNFCVTPAAGGLKRYEELPGPKELPFIRNLHHVFTGTRPQIHNLWTNLALKHGPLYRRATFTTSECRGACH